MARIIKIIFLFIFSFFIHMSTISKAADHMNLEEGLPVELEDTYPTPYKNIEYQQQVRFDLTSTNKSDFRLDQRIEYGFARNWQTRIGLPVKLGTGVNQGLGDVTTEVFYNFNTESVWVPSTAMAAKAIFPSYGDSRGVDMAWKFLALKKLRKNSLFERVAVNATWFHNFDKRINERSDLYKIVTGYYRRITPTTIGIIDYVREQHLEKGKIANIIEIGFRTQLNPMTLAGIGFGVGVSKDSPNFRMTLSLQHALNNRLLYKEPKKQIYD